MVLSILTLLIFVFRQRKTIQIKKRNEIYLLEIARLKEENYNKEVDFKKKQVTEFALQINEQNKLLNQFKFKLNDIKKNIKDSSSSDDIKSLQILINESIEINNEKVQLNTEIKNSQESFLYNLKNKFPDLTEKQIQMSTLLRLGFNTKQISKQLNISDRAINNYRGALRKKLGLTKDQNLNVFLKEI